MVERIVQVISGSLGCLVWPKQLHDLLPVEAVTAGEGEQLYQGGRLPEPPCLFRDGSRTYANPKATEQPDAHRLGSLARRHPRSCYAFKASRRAHSRASPFLVSFPTISPTYCPTGSEYKTMNRPSRGRSGPGASVQIDRRESRRADSNR